ncbi:MAG: GGDEF domain-containing protein [Clostridia bacterium]|nr:GGDEF domain-containing protein [Clostridia bacterium]
MNDLNDDHHVMQLSISTVNTEKCGAMAKVLLFQDITERINMESQLRLSKAKYKELAFTDCLTKLPNRRVFFDRFKTCVASYQTGKSDFTVINLDLNNFKYVNDAYGHSMGDEVLIEAGNRFKKFSDTENVSEIFRVADSNMFEEKRRLKLNGTGGSCW